MFTLNHDISRKDKPMFYKDLANSLQVLIGKEKNSIANMANTRTTPSTVTVFRFMRTLLKTQKQNRADCVVYALLYHFQMHNLAILNLDILSHHFAFCNNLDLGDFYIGNISVYRVSYQHNIYKIFCGCRSAFHIDLASIHLVHWDSSCLLYKKGNLCCRSTDGPMWSGVILAFHLRHIVSYTNWG